MTEAVAGWIAMKTKLPMSKVRSLGGIARGKAEREKAIARYMKSPNFCKHCGAVIIPSESQKVSDVKRKQFCNQSCNASYQNKSKPKRKRSSHQSGVCEGCGNAISYKARSDGRYSLRRFCETCLSVHRAHKLGAVYVSLKTKAALFASRNGYQSARGSIQNHARRTYERSGKPMQCVVCGYSLHIEVAHIRDVASFHESSTISEINNILNLVALCPTHHWEYDNGLLDINANLSSLNCCSETVSRPGTGNAGSNPASSSASE